MNNLYKQYPCPYYYNAPMSNPQNMHQLYQMYQYPFWLNPAMYGQMYAQGYQNQTPKLKDYGPDPYVVNIEEATVENTTFRTAIWTGENLQLTVMSIAPGDDIGLEVHPDGDQFIRIEEGQGLVQMGNSEDNLNYQKRVSDDFAILIPAGKWHNVINTGNTPLKLYVVYAPPEHPFGTVHETKEDAEDSEMEYSY